jgi:hypothetical protein
MSACVRAWVRACVRACGIECAHGFVGVEVCGSVRIWGGCCRFALRCCDAETGRGSYHLPLHYLLAVAADHGGLRVPLCPAPATLHGTRGCCRAAAAARAPRPQPVEGREVRGATQLLLGRLRPPTAHPLLIA